MCLLFAGLDTLGFLLRVWLWISVPMAVIILLLATYFNYWHHARSRGGLKLAMEGWGANMRPDGGEPYIHQEDVVGEGEAVLGEEAEESTPRGPVREDAEVRAITNEVQAITDEGPAITDTDFGTDGETALEEELGATGKETIYRGILWMKEKYEQYREQADRRVEQLRDELGRSELRYRELLTVMEDNKNRAPDIAEVETSPDITMVETSPDISKVESSPETKVESSPELTAVRGQLSAKQAIIQDLEAQLHSERIKVEELVAVLQANMEMLRKVIPDLGKYM